MEPSRAADTRLTPDAAEFVRFCYRRRTVGWPELYDEMCAVASRGLFRGWGPSDLAEHGIGFGLFELPALAGLAGRIVAEEQAERRATARLTVRIVAEPEIGSAVRVGENDSIVAEDDVTRPGLVSLAS
jgi:hypothetical protein